MSNKEIEIEYETVYADEVNLRNIIYSCRKCGNYHYHGSMGSLKNRTIHRSSHCHLESGKQMKIIIDDETNKINSLYSNL